MQRLTKYSLLIKRLSQHVVNVEKRLELELVVSYVELPI